MTKRAVVPGVELLEHPAMKGWSTVWPTRVEPAHIEILQKRKKSVVYRLVGVGPDGSDIIAKRSWATKALVERTIYEEILPLVSVPTVSYYGFLEEEDGEFAWLFLSSADGEEYSPYIREHRVLAARWLGLVHTSTAAGRAAARLPDRGPGYYLERLRSAHDRILGNLANPALTADDLVVLRTVARQCEIVASQWSRIRQLCARVPPTLVHGDFAPKNIRAQTGRPPIALLPFDWGSAGWGSVAADLGQAGMAANNFWASPDLAVYCSVVGASWPDLDVRTLQALAIRGQMFRCLVCIDLDAQSLATQWVEKCMSNMRIYTEEMAEALQAAEEAG